MLIDYSKMFNKHIFQLKLIQNDINLMYYNLIDCT